LGEGFELRVEKKAKFVDVGESVFEALGMDAERGRKVNWFVGRYLVGCGSTAALRDVSLEIRKDRDVLHVVVDAKKMTGNCRRFEEVLKIDN
jgi:hypothetical protein